LSARLADVASYDEAGALAITQARAAAEALNGDGWLARVVEGEPSGPLEELFAAVRATVYARDESGGQEGGYGLETEAAGLDGPFIEAAQNAGQALGELRRPLVKLGLRLEAILADPPDWLDGQAARGSRARGIAGLARRSDRRVEALLARVGGEAGWPDFVDWLALDRSDGREFDMGLHRHWLDPMRPLPPPCSTARMA
jgi:ATP-dependent DNA helicase DinG